MFARSFQPFSYCGDIRAYHGRYNDVMKVIKTRVLKAKLQIEVTLQNGEKLFLPVEMAGRLEVEEVDEPLLSELRALSAYTAAKETALRLLGIREHFESELRMKLLRRKFPRDVVDKVLMELKEKNYQDDERAGRMFVESLASKGGIAKRKITALLASKLGSKEKAVEITNGVLPEDYDFKQLARIEKHLSLGLLTKMNEEIRRKLAKLPEEIGNTAEMGREKSARSLILNEVNKIKAKHRKKYFSKLISLGFSSESAMSSVKRVFLDEEI